MRQAIPAYAAVGMKFRIDSRKILQVLTSKVDSNIVREEELNRESPNRRFFGRI